MKSKISESINLKNYPIAVILTDEKPAEGLQFKENTWGCVASMMVAASKGKTVIFDRKNFGCVGGGTGLGFGDQYKDFPIDCLLSTGNTEYKTYRRSSYLREGERYFKTRELAQKFVDLLPMREVPAEYVIFKPLNTVKEEDDPELVIFLVNADQLSALVVLANYSRGESNNVIAPFGAGCHSILFGYSEAERENPRAVIGFFDISARKHIGKDLLSFTVPYKMFQEMESNVEESFLEKGQWKKIKDRIN
jgi:uncharacterized protein (DUF169 family)